MYAVARVNNIAGSRSIILVYVVLVTYDSRANEYRIALNCGVNIAHCAPSLPLWRLVAVDCCIAARNAGAIAAQEIARPAHITLKCA
jgi:hypothetical protein